MAKREALGFMKCPECDFEKAEIKLQKCGEKLYRYCPECNAQTFARTPAQETAMRRHITAPKAAAQVGPEDQPAPEGRAVAKPVPTAAPKVVKKSAFAEAMSVLAGGNQQ